jgi:integrase
MAIKLTDKEVRNLAPPAAGNHITYDTEVKGFGARVTAAREQIVDGKPVVTGGARSFVLNYRADGRERRITIGSFPDWTVSAARERAKTLKRNVDMGEDPMGDRHADRTAPTIETLAKRYMAEHATRKRPRSAKEDKSLIDQLIVPKLGTRRVLAVDRDEIEKFHREVSKATPVRANRALSLLTKMFNLAIGWKYRSDNPCAGLERNQENKRDRYLKPAELERLMVALATHNNKTSANVVRLLLLTGARRGEVLGATWDQFDLETGVWTKPAATTKQKKLHRVPLSAPARLLLAEMHDKKEGDALFPGRRDNNQQTDLKRFWASVCQTAGLSIRVAKVDDKGRPIKDAAGDVVMVWQRTIRVHDLRHSYASYLASAGLSLPVIGALLGHTSPVTTQRYAHLLDDPLRAATEKVGVVVMGTGKPSAEVVPMAGKRA